MDEEQVERELNDIERAIGLLKREYEIFFTGGSRQPPIQAQMQLGSRIRRSSSMVGSSYAQRFRYNTLASRFNTYQELWNKQLRLKEEGRSMPSPKTAKVKETPRPPERTETWEDKLNAIFEAYCRCREETGEGKGSLRFEQFRQTLSRERENLIKKLNCKDVDFSIKIEAGKTKLKAKPVK